MSPSSSRANRRRKRSLRLINNNFLFPFEGFYAIINPSSGRGEIPDRRYSPRRAKAAFDSAKFRNRQYSLDGRRRQGFLLCFHGAQGHVLWVPFFVSFRHALGGELLPSRLRRATSLEEGGIFSGSLMLCTGKSSLFEGMELAARCAGNRQAECRRSVSEAD